MQKNYKKNILIRFLEDRFIYKNSQNIEEKIWIRKKFMFGFVATTSSDIVFTND